MPSHVKHATVNVECEPRKWLMGVSQVVSEGQGKHPAAFPATEPATERQHGLQWLNY